MGMTTVKQDEMACAAGRQHAIYRVTIVGAVLNLVLIIFKMLAGILGRSGAMVADAIHSLSDFVTDVIVLVFVRISNKPRDVDHDYGHGKYETLATALIGVLLFVVGVGVLAGGCSSILAYLRGETLGQPGMVALWAAVVSVVTKEWLYRYTRAVGRRANSKAVVANAWHHRSDALSSVGTMVGVGGAILLGEDWRVLDPLAAVVVSVFILKVSADLVRPCVDELLEKSLPEDMERDITRLVLSAGGVAHLHNLCTRRIGNNVAIEFHICMDGNLSLTEAHRTASHIEELLREAYGERTHIVIHVEPLEPGR
ncbi:cation diffusion facilitator family transporter [Prevotella sp. CAG:755]|nr:cation diffusion facilitator family transporter [Prevotella sp. CAG:755]